MIPVVAVASFGEANRSRGYWLHCRALAPRARLHNDGRDLDGSGGGVGRVPVCAGDMVNVRP